jgi:parallel beta-helix repeat protein
VNAKNEIVGFLGNQTHFITTEGRTKERVMMKKKHLCTIVIFLVFMAAGVQPTFAFYSIPSDTSIGTLVGRTFTLNTNVAGTIQIDESDLTLDGGGFTVTPSAVENTNGIFASSKTNITITNVTIGENVGGVGFDTGIHIQQSDNISITDNTVSGCDVSINSSGIWLNLTYGSNITNNIVSNNSYGIRLSGSYSNIDIGNTLTNNSVSNNGEYAIYLSGSTYNTLTLNTISDNYRGLRILSGSNYNNIYNNNFINTTGSHASVTDSTGIVFSLSLPTGGNYWDDWTSPDADNNGIVDGPYPGIYVIPGTPPILDDFPWVVENGWLIPVNQPPTAEAGPDQTVDQDSPAGASVTLDGSGSSDDGQVQPLTYAWSWAGGGSSTGVTPTVTLPLGTTTVTLTVYDGVFDDTDTVDITVQSVQPPEYVVADIIDFILEDMYVPKEAEKEVGKAVKELNKAIKEFKKDKTDKAIKKIAKAAKELKKAQAKGADTQGVIDELNDLVQGL